MIEIDGSKGEGGGQVLRSALSLSMCTDQPFHMINIRARREKPGLMRQHLTAVLAAASVCDGHVSGADVGSLEVTFRPGRVNPGDYSFAIGTAGSCTLVLQTLLPALMTASETSTIRISGGTHNKSSPPVDFLTRSYLPLIERMGPQIRLELIRHGFHPRGGGEILVKVTPTARLAPLHVMHRGTRSGGYAEAYIAGIPLHVATRELEIVGKMLNWPAECLHTRGLAPEMGPGNTLTITVEHDSITEVFAGFGEKGVSAESVAKRAIDGARHYMASEAAVGRHLADQLLLPMALAGAGAFTTTPVSQHFNSQVAITQQFLQRPITVNTLDTHVHVTVG